MNRDRMTDPASVAFVTSQVDHLKADLARRDFNHPEYWDLFILCVNLDDYRAQLAAHQSEGDTP